MRRIVAEQWRVVWSFKADMFGSFGFTKGLNY